MGHASNKDLKKKKKTFIKFLGYSTSGCVAEYNYITEHNTIWLQSLHHQFEHKNNPTRTYINKETNLIK